MGKLKDQWRENNQRFKADMAANNQKFKSDLKRGKQSPPSKRAIKNTGIVLSLIFLAPLGLYLMLKSTWSRKYKLITTSLMAGVVALVILAPPVEPELANLNIQKNQDVITDTYTLQGDIKGTLESVKINGEDVSIKESKLIKEIKLQPGNNEIKLLATAKIDDVHRELKNETYNIYFDYEAMLYAEQLKKEQQEAEALKKKLESIPNYEIVRKEGMQDGFSAVMYVDGPIEDYLLTNAIKNFKSKNSDKNISVLVFDKADKEHVEEDMESEDPSGLVPHVRANYEKRDGNEQFFLFPTGLEGSKLAVEV